MPRRLKIENVGRILNGQERANIEIASGIYARAYNADPFARRRIDHYMRMGYELPSDVIEHASAVLKARNSRVAYIGEQSNTDHRA